VLTGLLSLIAMLLLRHLAPRVPAALVVAVVATILVGLLGGEAAGVSVVGELPSGLPHLVLPKLDFAVLQELAPGALAIVLVGYAEALGAALRALRPRTPDPAWSWPVVGEGVKSCPRAGCGQSASPVR
jgi:MFS superfamily sulfate permease-like transporter